MPGWLAKLLGTLATGGALAGLSGLVIAGGMRADVENLETRVEQDHIKTGEMAEAIAALEVEVVAVKNEVSKQRKEQREDAREVDRKLDRILERLPKE